MSETTDQLAYLTRPFARDEAWTSYDVVTFSERHVEVHFATNDDGDTGYPGEYASEMFPYFGEGALDRALRHTGKSRQGVGQRVVVRVDGKAI